MKMFTHTAKPDWKTIRVEGNNDQLIAAAMREPGEAWTIYIVNRSDTPRTVSLRSAPANTSFQTLTWDGTVKASDPAKSSADGTLELSLPPQSVTAATTLKVDWK